MEIPGDNLRNMWRKSFLSHSHQSRRINAYPVSYTHLKAVEELASHVANFSINEQDYSVLLRYFSFGLYRLKSYRVRLSLIHI